MTMEYEKFEPPDGKYKIEPVKYGRFTTKNGREKYMVECEIVEGEFAGKRFTWFGRMDGSDRSYEFFLKQMVALGLREGVPIDDAKLERAMVRTEKREYTIEQTGEKRYEIECYFDAIRVRKGNPALTASLDARSAAFFARKPLPPLKAAPAADTAAVMPFSVAPDDQEIPF